MVKQFEGDSNFHNQQDSDRFSVRDLERRRAQGAPLEEESEEGDEAGRTMDELVTKLEFVIIDHPLAAVGVAFAAGWLAGRLLR